MLRIICNIFVCTCNKCDIMQLFKKTKTKNSKNLLSKQTKHDRANILNTHNYNTLILFESIAVDIYILWSLQIHFIYCIELKHHKCQYYNTVNKMFQWKIANTSIVLVQLTITDRWSKIVQVNLWCYLDFIKSNIIFIGDR